MKVGRVAAVGLFLIAAVPFQAWAAEETGPAKVPPPAVPPAPTPAAPAPAPPGTDYQVGPGDVLNIEVLRDKDLNRAVIVLPDGKIAYPLIGEIVAEGKTVAQLKKEVEEKLARYLQDAVVAVEVRQMSSLQIYVLGMVGSPGRVSLTSNVNVLQALAIAGGPGTFARKSRIRIFRQEGGKTVIIPFDYDDVTAGKNLESNIQLKRGDIIFVP